ncbi:TIGR03757 family integrating conjugative element protein [Halorhodospira halophila]|uniref:TIGR03757 family integrating conjugative element protein n=1 Tax=Halorhodospira halophila TaxID=1053 RepID=UPI001F5E2A54|nr:TIGR03757 family integrating conjugative element protein [Halorhodospira halophila]MBK5944842.1 integrating conjugative element protein [Halorhodospira halophila]
MLRRLPPLLLIALVAPAGAAAERVEVFVAGETHTPQAAPSDVTIYRVDKAQERISALEARLPDDPDEALRTARRLVDGPEEERLGEALRAVALAIGLGIEQVPAVVFDRTTVVYGVADPDEARQHLQEAIDDP